MSINSFQFSPSTGLPRMLVKGLRTEVDISWFSDETLVITSVLAVYTLKQGSTVLLDGVAALPGTPDTTAKFTIPSSVTQGLTPSDNLIEIWGIKALLGGVPVKVEARRSVHLVLTPLWSMITDADLLSRHSRLNDMLPPSTPDWSGYRETAWEILNRDLIKRGRRPELVLDSFALLDAHLYKALSLIFRDLTTLVGDGRYRDLAEMYEDMYKAEWETIQFRYDVSQDNNMDAGEIESGSPSLWLGVPPGHPSSVVRGS